MGVGKRLREYAPKIKVVGVQPDSAFHGLEGLKHIPTSIRPRIYDPNFADQIIEVGTEQAQGIVKSLAKEQGILVGPSSGAAVAASLRIAEEVANATIVAILPDSGERYLSENFWKDVL